MFKERKRYKTLGCIIAEAEGGEAEAIDLLREIAKTGNPVAMDVIAQIDQPDWKPIKRHPLRDLFTGKKS